MGSTEATGLRASSFGANVTVPWAATREADLIACSTMGQGFTYLGLRLDDRRSARMGPGSRFAQRLARPFVRGGRDILLVVDALASSPQELLDEVRARSATNAA